MKKSFTKRILVLLVIMVMASGAIFAATTADLTLAATVVPILEISLVEETVADNLNLTTGEAGTLVGTATVTSNGTAGYKISAVSTNALTDQGRLIGGSTGSYVNYALTFATMPVTYTGAFFYTSTTGTVFNAVNHLINITIPAGTPLADSYSDTITFTITAQ